MELQSLLVDLLPKWKVLLLVGVRLLFIAAVFEFAAWWLGRRVEKLATPFINLDQGRDPKWRATRRATLRGVPKIVSRTTLYVVALILVFEVFGVPVLPLSLAVGAVAALFGAALLPTLRDYAQGYSLLSEDSVAPGDVVEINGHRGRVEKWTLRGTWLRDEAGHLHVLSNRNVQAVVQLERAQQETLNRAVAFDPLAAVPDARTAGAKPAPKLNK